MVFSALMLCVTSATVVCCSNVSSSTAMPHTGNTTAVAETDNTADLAPTLGGQESPSTWRDSATSEWPANQRALEFASYSKSIPQNSDVKNIPQNTDVKNKTFFAAQGYSESMQQNTGAATGGDMHAEHQHEPSEVNANVPTNSSVAFDMSPIMSGAILHTYPVRLKDCQENDFVHISGSSGEIYETISGDGLTGTELMCRLKIQAPEGMYLSAIVQSLIEVCPYIELRAYDDTGLLERKMNVIQSVVVFSSTNKMYLAVYWRPQGISQQSTFKIRFQATKISYQKVLDVVMTSPFSGYLNPPGFQREKHQLFAFSTNASHTVHIPRGRVLVTSFPVFDVDITNTCVTSLSGKAVELRLTTINNTERTLWRKCGRQIIPIELHYGCKALTVHFEHNLIWSIKGFQMLFSFHTEATAPVKLASGLFNCSVPHYASFKQHVHCNLEPECQGGEDEGGHCPFSAPGCHGKLGYKDKCFQLLRHAAVDRKVAEGECRKVGGRLAMLKTRGEWDAFLGLFRYGRTTGVIVHLGMTSTDASMPDIYRRSTMWADKTLSYETNIVIMEIKDYKQLPSFFAESLGQIFPYTRFETFTSDATVCEFDNPTRREMALGEKHGKVTDGLSGSFGETVHVNPLVYAATSKENSMHNGVRMNDGVRFSLREGLHTTLQTHHFTVCPLRHVTHSFLKCSLDSQCGATYSFLSCEAHFQSPVTGAGTKYNESNVSDDVSVSMFECEDGRGSVHYTLVCDFRPDCQDGSDEAFCRHGQLCEGFTCSNGQCVDRDRRCDLVRNCVDGTDEDNCYKHYNISVRDNVRCRIPPPALVEFAYAQDFTQTPMDESQSCPDTHFRCPGESNYCLPVYVRCNGVYDCAGHEDEANCENYSCPGYYRCRGFSSSLTTDNPSLITNGVVIPGYARTGSTVCVHADHLCDGMAQCPLHDDELFCDQKDCPAGCMCQGLAFLCRQPFPVHNFANIRYLDGAKSGLTLSDITALYYLVWVSLAECGLQVLSPLEFANLQTLDLSDNLLSSVTMETFHKLKNLRDVRLAGNPLVFVRNGHVEYMHGNLHRVDLSRTRLKTFDSSVFSNFTQIQYLNISYSTLESVSENSFHFMPELREIDIRGSPVRHFPVDLFKGLDKLSVVFASNYKLCCQSALSEGFDRRYCLAPEHELSSCENLLKSELYRALFWLLCIVVIFGNLWCMVAVCFSDRKSLTPSCTIFLANRNLADLLMGSFLVAVSTADVLYSGEYALFEEQWTGSAACKAAGFFSLVSMTVSSFLICMITLDRCIAIYSQLHNCRRHFVCKSYWVSALACLVAWSVGTVFAALPLSRKPPNVTLEQGQFEENFLLPASQLEFYSSSGLCTPILTHMESVWGRNYYLGVVLIVNFIVYFITAVSLTFLKRLFKRVPLSLNKTAISQEVTISRRFVTTVTSNVACWFGMCFVGFLVTAGVFFPKGVVVFAAAILIPINSGLNPFLYLLSLRLERKREEAKARLVKVLSTRIASSRGCSKPVSHSSELSEKDD